MNPYLGWLIWHLSRGYDLPGSEAAWTARYGAPSPGLWAAAAATAQATIAAAAAFLTVDLNDQLISFIDPSLIAGPTIDVTFTVEFLVGSRLVTSWPVVIDVPLSWTAGQVWQEALAVAQQMAAQSGGQVNRVTIVPPVI